MKLTIVLILLTFSSTLSFSQATSEIQAMTENTSQLRLRSNDGSEVFDIRMNNDGILRFIANGNSSNEAMQIDDDNQHIGVGAVPFNTIQFRVRNTEFTSGVRIGVAGSAVGGGSGVRYGVHGAADSGTGNRFGVYGYASTGPSHWGVYCAGNFWYSGSMTSTSDGRLKSNIRESKNGLTEILKLKPRSYNFNQESAKGIPLAQGPQIGFIAQELEKVLPQLVETQMHTSIKNPGEEIDGQTVDNIEIKGINYMGLIPVLTKAIQEQQEIIERLEARIVILEKGE